MSKTEKRIRGILIDLDGTVQGPEFDAIPSDENAFWIRRADQEKDVPTGVITARPRRFAIKSIEKMGITLVSAFDGGARLVLPRSGGELPGYTVSMKRPAQLAALAIARDMSIDLFDTNNQFDGRPIKSKNEVSRKNTKLYAGALHPEVAELFANRVNEVSGLAAYPATSWTPGSYADVHITSARANKEHASEVIIDKLLKCRRDEVVAIGDGHLDIGLLSMGTRSYAMANSPPEVIRAARFLVPAWNQNGVSDAIKHALWGVPLPPIIYAADYPRHQSATPAPLN